MQSQSADENGENKDDASGHGSTVAKHYNELQECGLKARGQSRIFFMRNFNNWTKSMSIGDTLTKIRQGDWKKKISVLDLCCGKGGDLLKWKKGQINHLICVDIAGVSVEQAKSRYQEMKQKAQNDRYHQNVFSAEFYTADCSKTRICELYEDPDTYFDLCSCQFSFHYSFESLSQARMMLRNACERLKPGGYFIGTTPNANELVKRLQESEGVSFGNEVYRITFENKDSFPLFGCKYDFHLDGVVDCPEFLVYMPLMQEMAKEFDMELVCHKTFKEYFDEYSSTKEGASLLQKMKALQHISLENSDEYQGKSEFHHVEEKYSSVENKRSHIGTLSKSEWEATSLYCVYIYKKSTGTSAAQEDTGSEHEQQEDRDDEDLTTNQLDVEPSPSKKRKL
ncbi:mRNA cap guanine-N7 methyltransferase-like [Anneissia japonica]|uniref:mRNA cap guanine-N7 methyltransferase-like n=1 Tax=Anneissia japonica TaxID=1529436 RepID=UPI0014256B51|nr:mRNA cap guanine-N7 methyltransferase-like [Anneissia japonica]